MIRLQFFASLRERLALSQQELALPENASNVAELVEYLVANGSEAMSLLNDEQQVLVAVNQVVVDRTTAISDNDEIAFFPPMTGG